MHMLRGQLGMLMSNHGRGALKRGAEHQTAKARAAATRTQPASTSVRGCQLLLRRSGFDGEAADLNQFPVAR